jgi:hypothetical protein
LRPPRVSRVGQQAAAVAGVGPGGEAAEVGGLRSGDASVVVLMFLTSSCHGCREFWEVLSVPGSRAELEGSPRVAIITPGPELEDRRKVTELAPEGMPVVMSARTWAEYGVSGSPFAVVVRDGRIAGEAPLFCWDDLRGVLARTAGGERAG